MEQDGEVIRFEHMGRIRIFRVILVMLWLVMGCSGAPASPTQPPVETPATALSTLTATPALTSTPLPTATEKRATPTLTPEPGLQTNGPYFAYFQQDEHGIRRLVLMDADGVGRKIIELPKGIAEAFAVVQPPVPDMRWLSPDGKWLAFYTGSAGEYVEMPAPGTADLTLNLLDLATGEEQVITPLLSKDYPNNLVEAAGQLNVPDITAEYLYQAFVDGITRALAWSPDGQYLAFAGQMDGLSSDLYLYDVIAKTIRRLSSGDQELQWIDWSPDGRWIVHSGVYGVGMGMTFDIYAASPNGGAVPYLSTNSSYTGVEKWLNSHTYFESDNQNGPGSYGLRLVDINTGKITKIWDGSYLSYETDTDGKWVIVNALLPDISPYISSNDANFEPGPYVIDLTTLKKKKMEFPSEGIFLDYVAFPFNLDGQKFVLMGDGSRSYFLSESLELTALDVNSARVAISPDSNYWIAITNNATMVYSKDNELVTSVPLELQYGKMTEIAWKPDSSGAFLIYDTNIYFLNISTRQINLIETDRITNHYGEKFMWIDSK